MPLGLIQTSPVNPAQVASANVSILTFSLAGKQLPVDKTAKLRVSVNKLILAIVG